jgi:hypothetical protein
MKNFLETEALVSTWLCLPRWAFAAAAQVNSQTPAVAISTVATTSEERRSDLSDVVNYCSRQLGLQGLACLAASSQQYKKTCLQTACSDATNLLVDAVQEAAAATGMKTSSCKVSEHVQAVAWLLQVAPEAATAPTTAQHVLCLPSVPLHVAKQFV